MTRLADLMRFVAEPMADYLAGGRQETDVRHWVRENRAMLPPLRFDCGRDDSLIDGNRALHAALMEENVPHIYEEHDGGHTWDYWQRHVGSTLRFVSQLETDEVSESA